MMTGEIKMDFDDLIKHSKRCKKCNKLFEKNSYDICPECRGLKDIYYVWIGESNIPGKTIPIKDFKVIGE